MRYQQDALEMAAKVLQFLDHHLPAVAIQAAKTLINDDGLNAPMLPAGVLADPQRQADRNAKSLTAAQESNIDGAVAGGAIVCFEFEGELVPAPSLPGQSRRNN